MFLWFFLASGILLLLCHSSCPIKTLHRIHQGGWGISRATDEQFLDFLILLRQNHKIRSFLTQTVAIFWLRFTKKMLRNTPTTLLQNSNRTVLTHPGIVSAVYRYRLILWVAVLIKGSRRSRSLDNLEVLVNCSFTSARINSSCEVI